jgi:hypothetical protein
MEGPDAAIVCVSPAALEVMRVDSAREPTGMVGLVFGGVGRHCGFSMTW